MTLNRWIRIHRLKSNRISANHLTFGCLDIYLILNWSQNLKRILIKCIRLCYNRLGVHVHSPSEVLLARGVETLATAAVLMAGLSESGSESEPESDSEDPELEELDSEESDDDDDDEDEETFFVPSVFTFFD
jgi:hypothetical protein